MDMVYILAMVGLVCFILGFMLGALSVCLTPTRNQTIIAMSTKAKTGCIPECPTSKKDTNYDADHTHGEARLCACKSRRKFPGVQAMAGL